MANLTISAYAAATGAKVKQFTIKAPYYRVVWTIAGTTPSYTFTIHTLEG